MTVTFRQAMGAWIGGYPLGETKSDPTGEVRTAYSRNRPVSTPTDYHGYARQGYQANVVVKRCIEMVSIAVADLPLKLQQFQGGEWKDKKDPNSPLWELMAKPNPNRPAQAFWGDVISYYLMRGDSYILGNTPLALGAAPTELYTLRPDRVKIVPSDRGVPGAYEFSVNSRTQTFKCDPLKNLSPIMHMKTFNPLDDWYGQPPLQAAALNVSSMNAGAEWNASMLTNSGRPPGAFRYAPDGEPGAVMTDKQKQTLEREIDVKLVGPRNARKPLILDGGLDWVDFSLTPAEMEWLEGIRDAARFVCLSFGVPSMLLGIPGDNTYSNYKEARQALYVDTVLPVGRLFHAYLNAWLLPAFGENLRIVVDMPKVDALSEMMKEKWEAANAASFLTINEKRALVFYEPIESEEADEVYIPSSVIPLSTALAMPDEGAVDENGDPVEEDDGEEPIDGEPAKKPVANKPVKPGAKPAPLKNGAAKAARFDAAGKALSESFVSIKADIDALVAKGALK